MEALDDSALRRALRLSGSLERSDRPLQLVSVTTHEPERLPGREQKLGRRLLPVGNELERAREELDGALEGGERECALPCFL